MKQIFKEIALQVGGSHYPDVGGQLLEKFGEEVVNQCIAAVKNTDLRKFTLTTYDKDRNDTIVHLCTESIKQTFKE